MIYLIATMSDELLRPIEWKLNTGVKFMTLSETTIFLTLYFVRGKNDTDFSACNKILGAS